MSNYITGFCATGGCEGSNKFSASGARLGPCRGSYEYRRTNGDIMKIRCTHECHSAFEEIRQMMAAMGKIHTTSAPAVTQETRTPPVSPITAVSPAPLKPGPSTTTLLPFKRATVEGILRTPTGRAGKGQLEEQVRLALKKSAVFVEMGMVTPGYISRLIDKENPPSQGAIGAVMDRWEKKGLINIGRKPLRISKVTNLGERILLEK